MWNGGTKNVVRPEHRSQQIPTMDIYGDDIDTILDINSGGGGGGDDDDDPLNNAKVFDDAADYDNNGDYADTGDAPNDDDAQTGTGGQKVEPKRRAVRNPRLVLNAERLIGARGVHEIERGFVGIRFAGKGHEAADLDNVLKRLEHWAHRLYPRYNFPDFIATAEKLGRKKLVQRHMDRYRQGLLEPRASNSDDENGGAGAAGHGGGNDDDDERTLIAEPIDELDDLIGQQIEKYRTRTPGTTAGALNASSQHNDSTFNALRGTATAFGTPSFVGGRVPVEASTPMNATMVADTTADEHHDVRPLPATPAPKLSAEQMARIADNRRLAQERLLAKKLAAAEEMMRQQLLEQEGQL